MKMIWSKNILFKNIYYYLHFYYKIYLTSTLMNSCYKEKFDTFAHMCTSEYICVSYVAR